MKKVLALLLTLLLTLSLGTAALAAGPIPIGPHDLENCEIDTGEYRFHLCPGESYPCRALNGELSFNGISNEDNHQGNAAASLFAPASLNSYLGGDYSLDLLSPDKAWKVSADWDIGGAMVEAVKWDSDIGKIGSFVVKLNENYTISAPKKLEGTITFTNRKDKNVSIDYSVAAIVTNHLITVDGYKKAADAKDNPYVAQDNTLYQCDEDNPGYTTFNDGRLLGCTLKMVKNEKAFMFNDEDMIDAVEEKYGDTDARIDCYSFGGSPKFTNDAAFTLQADYADQYKVYTWDGTALHPQKYAWNSVDGVYEWTTKAPTNYVIADKELLAGAETADTAKDAAKNPDTGANDLVGVAAALAVVSLVAGAAVSLKK